MKLILYVLFQESSHLEGHSWKMLCVRIFSKYYPWTDTILNNFLLILLHLSLVEKQHLSKPYLYRPLIFIIKHRQS